MFVVQCSPRIVFTRLCLVCAATVTLCFSALASATLQPANGRVMLTVSGNIQQTNNGDAAELDQDLFSAIGTTRITTKTPWTDSADTYEGVLVRDLLRHLGAKSNRFRAIAHNDYEVTVEGIDFDRYPIILATHVNGKRMSLRNKGPVWLIFPWDEYPELNVESSLNFSIWQMKAIVVQ